MTHFFEWIDVPNNLAQDGLDPEMRALEESHLVQHDGQKWDWKAPQTEQDSNGVERIEEPFDAASDSLPVTDHSIEQADGNS